MKVHIGPYKNFFGPYNISDALSCFGISEINCDRFGDYLSRTWLSKFLNWIYKKRQRKEYVHIDNYDIWSLDHTLSLIIVPALKLLKEKKHGTPGVDDNDVPDNIKSTTAGPKKDEWDTDEFWEKRWEYVLDEMVWAMEQIKTPDQDDIFFTYDNPDDILNSVCKIDHDGLKKYHDRISNGTRLFGKYFRNLWD